ncbi:MAG: alpha/beta fold hydrolase [Actinomycetota bacterium]
MPAYPVRLQPLEPTLERFIEIDGLRTFSRTIGEGRDVALVHGAGVSSRYWLPAQRLLAARGPYRVHALDFPGFGKSDDPPWPPEFSRLMLHLERWLDQAVGEPVHLIGQSVGCEIAAMTAVARPESVRSVVLAAPAGLPCLPSLFRQCVRALCDAPYEQLRLYPAIIPDYLRSGPVRVWRLLRQQQLTEVGCLLPLIRQPSLVLRGRRDMVVSEQRAADVANLLTHSALSTIEGAHGAHFTHADAFVSTVIPFLRQVDNPDHQAAAWADSPAPLLHARDPICAGRPPLPGG